MTPAALHARGIAATSKAWSQPWASSRRYQLLPRLRSRQSQNDRGKAVPDLAPTTFIWGEPGFPTSAPISRRARRNDVVPTSIASSVLADASHWGPPHGPTRSQTPDRPSSRLERALQTERGSFECRRSADAETRTRINDTGPVNPTGRSVRHQRSLVTTAASDSGSFGCRKRSRISSPDRSSPSGRTANPQFLRSFRRGAAATSFSIFIASYDAINLTRLDDVPPSATFTENNVPPCIGLTTVFEPAPLRLPAAPLAPASRRRVAMGGSGTSTFTVHAATVPLHHCPSPLTNDPSEAAVTVVA